MAWTGHVTKMAALHSKLQPLKTSWGWLGKHFTTHSQIISGRSSNMSFLFAIFLCLPALALCQVDEVHSLADDVFRRLDLDGDVHVEKQELVDYFKTYDRNGDGRVSQQEYVTVIDSIYAGNPEWQRITHGLFNKLDYNNDIHLDVLDYDRIFSSADANANGLVAEAEFNAFFHNLVNGRP